MREFFQDISCLYVGQRMLLTVLECFRFWSRKEVVVKNKDGNVLGVDDIDKDLIDITIVFTSYFYSDVLRFEKGLQIKFVEEGIVFPFRLSIKIGQEQKENYEEKRLFKVYMTLFNFLFAKEKGYRFYHGEIFQEIFGL
jgi:hypothetical protein